MSVFTSLFSAADGAPQPSGEEMIEKLTDRLSSAMMIDDRRAAVKGLRAMAKQYKVEVGNLAMPLLVDSLKNDRTDTEMTTAALEALIFVMQGSEDGSENVGPVFTEIFVKAQDNVYLLLMLLEETDFHVRYNTVKLLTILVSNRPAQLQDCILSSPIGVSKLVDLLSDSREIIRNEGLLLLVALTQNNANIQKIVAFESAFDRALAIVAEEGYAAGGVVVQDCIRLLRNLLADNISNHNLFRETSCIPKLVPFLGLDQVAPPANTDWLPQTVANIRDMLEIIRLLTEPSLPSSSRTQTQAAFESSGVLSVLLTAFVHKQGPESIRPDLLWSIGNVTRGYPANQNALQNITPGSNASYLVFILYAALDQTRPFREQAAALYVFASYLTDNADAQKGITATLLPTESSQSQAGHNIGPVLCQGLLAPNSPRTNWAAALGFSHVLLRNTECKESVLRVAITREAGKAPESLLAVCVASLNSAQTPELRLPYLTFLCCWLHGSSFAVKTFLQIQNVLSFLVALASERQGQSSQEAELVSGLASLLIGVVISGNDGTLQGLTSEDIRHIVTHRIGEDNFLGVLSKLEHCDALSRNEKEPRLVADRINDAWFDMDISASIKQAIGEVKAVFGGKAAGSVGQADAGSHATVHYHDTVVQQYKEMIRQQDEEIKQMRAQMQALRQQKETSENTTIDAGDLQRQLEEERAQHSETKTRLQEAERTIQNMSSQQSRPETTSDADTDTSDLALQLQTAHADLHELHSQNEKLKERAENAEAEAREARHRLAETLQEHQNLNKMHEDLLVYLAELDEKLRSYRARLARYGEEVTDEEDEGESVLSSQAPGDDGQEEQEQQSEPAEE